jgi:hypothetical protein
MAVAPSLNSGRIDPLSRDCGHHSSQNVGAATLFKPQEVGKMRP